jgi:hypothetical protein
MPVKRHLAFFSINPKRLAKTRKEVVQGADLMERPVLRSLQTGLYFHRINYNGAGLNSDVRTD